MSITSPAKFCANVLIQSLPRLTSSDWKRIHLLRHAETDWNTIGKLQGGGYDMELNDTDIVQAGKAANVLKQIQLILERDQRESQAVVSTIQLVVSSHLKRSAHTSDIIYEELIQTITQQTFSLDQTTNGIIRKKLKEFGEMKFGRYEGLLTIPSSPNTELDSFKEHQRKMVSDPTLRWPGHGGESVEDVINRLERGLQMIYQQYPTVSCICIVGHGKVNKILLQHLVPLALSALNQNRAMVVSTY